MISLTAMQIDDLVKVLKQSGARYANADAIRRDIDAGAPSNPDAPLAYTAWLIRGLQDTPRP